MQDSNITYTVQAKGIEEAEAKFKKLGATIKSVSINQDGSIAATGKLTTAQVANAQAMNRASNAQASYFAHIAKTTVQSALINKLFLEFIDVSDQAIKQVDLMNNFPATMASMGQATEASNVAFQKLRDYVGQVGGNLGEAASMVTRFTGVTNDVKASVAIFTGLNNALIAGDSNLQEQAQAAVQFAQAFERGKPDMKEWLSLTQNMSYQLALVAKSMGYVNAAALGEALRNGEENMGAFTAKLTELSTGMGPIAQQALARMNGMQFAFNVMKNTMIQGLAAIINAFGRSNIVSFFSFLTEVIQVVTQAVVFLINAFFGLINVIRGLFGLAPLAGMQKDAAGVASGIGDAAGAADDLGDGLKGAKKDAKDLNKSLASFDKMNVLPDKTSGGDGGGKDDGAGKGGTAFDAAQMGALGDAFNGISGALKEAGIWAKILAGILGGIAALKFGLGAIKQINDMIDTMKTAKKNVDDLNKKLKEMGNNAKTAFGKVGEGVKNINLSKGAQALSSAIGGFAAGIAGAIGAALWPAISAAIGPVLASIGGAIAAAIAAIAALPAIVIAAIVVAIIALIVGIVLLIQHWDEVMKWLGEAAENTGKWIVDAFKNTVKWVQDAWKNIGKFFKDVWDAIVKFAVDSFNNIKTAMTNFFTAVSQNPFVKVLVDIFKFLFDVIMTVVQIAFVAFQLAIIGLGAAVQWLADWFAKLWDDLMSTFSDVGQWFSDRFKEAWDGIVSAWNGAIKWFGDVWNGLMNIFSVVGQWFGQQFDLAWQAIVTAFTPLINWFKTTIWLPLVALFTPVVQFFTGVFTNAWNGIKAVWSVVSGFFQGIWNSITAIFGNVAGWFGQIFSNAYNAIVNAFGNIRNFVAGLWDGIANGLRGALQTAINTLYSGMRSVANFINGIIGSINKVASKVGIGTIGTISVPAPPQLARGGIVNQATLAMVGEDGAEAVVPLENNLEWIDKLAAKINANGGGNQPLQLTVQIGEDRIVTKVIDLINEKTQMSGRNKILV